MPRNRLRVLWLAALVAGGIAPVVTAKDEGPKPAGIEVSGLGWIRSRELQITLQRLLGNERGEVLDTNAIEDAAVMLAATLNQEGFQKPEIEVQVKLRDGTEKKMTFDASMETSLPRPLEATAVAFQVRPGVRSHFSAIEIEGLTAFPVDIGRAFFRAETTLFRTAKTNAYSTGRLNRGEDGLQSELLQRGYAEAKVTAEVARQDAANGDVNVLVKVNEGPRWEVQTITYEEGETNVTLPTTTHWAGRPWTPTLEEDLKELVRQAFYRAGYPDVGVGLALEPDVGEAGRKKVDVIVGIHAGAQVRVGRVRFVGNDYTRDAVLERRLRVPPGALLDPLRMERGRYRISRLGVFEAVDLEYEPTEGPTRDPVFTVREGPRRETSLLFGYGSYEQLRGGVEHRQINLFGRAHQSVLRLVQSMKSSNGEYTYTVPELLGESLDGTAKIFGLRREEVAFLRQEFGVTLSVQRPVPFLGAEGSVGYTYQSLGNRENELFTRSTDDKQVKVASVNFGLTSDRRDHPLRPRGGYRWTAQVELADRTLGGETVYQRAEIGGAYHTRWGATRWVHLGLTHGVITTLGDDDLNLPVNKRFFPGGDNSIRGYQKGEAAPRGADGLFVGAKSYLVFNAEVEQAIISQWSVVLFADALGMAAQLSGYPFQERLYAVGLGIRYQTLIGPLRVEYGRNVNPRLDDPSGTWQFSIGFPF